MEEIADVKNDVDKLKIDVSALQEQMAKLKTRALVRLWTF